VLQRWNWACGFLVLGRMSGPPYLRGEFQSRYSPIPGGNRRIPI
jgi:hypothetical protein